MFSLCELQVFISIALILGDGLYNFIKILAFIASSIHAKMKNKIHKTCKWVTFTCCFLVFIHLRFSSLVESYYFSFINFTSTAISLWQL